MALPKVTTPAQGATHNHSVPAQRTFSWDTGSPAVVPTHWRVKVGATPGSWNYYAGPPKAEPTHADTFTFTVMPPTGKTCYTFVEWSTNGGNTFPNQGAITSFVCKP
jgi:hypothetical protein